VSVAVDGGGIELAVLDLPGSPHLDDPTSWFCRSILAWSRFGNAKPVNSGSPANNLKKMIRKRMSSVGLGLSRPARDFGLDVGRLDE
jgi:hypothetical protein